jgi:hypothetical protein
MKCTALFCYIRCKAPDEKRASLLAPGGSLCRKRVHASRIPSDRVEGYLEELRDMNPGWSFAAVKGRA